MKALYYNANGEQTRTLEITSAVINDLQTINAIISHARGWAKAGETMLRLDIGTNKSSGFIKI